MRQYTFLQLETAGTYNKIAQFVSCHLQITRGRRADAIKVFGQEIRERVSIPSLRRAALRAADVYKPSSEVFSKWTLAISNLEVLLQHIDELDLLTAEREAAQQVLRQFLEGTGIYQESGYCQTVVKWEPVFNPIRLTPLGRRDLWDHHEVAFAREPNGVPSYVREHRVSWAVDSDPRSPTWEIHESLFLSESPALLILQNMGFNKIFGTQMTFNSLRELHWFALLTDKELLDIARAIPNTVASGFDLMGDIYCLDDNPSFPWTGRYKVPK